MQTLGMHNGIQPASSVEGRKSDDDYFWGLDAFPRPFLFLKCDELDLLCFETLSNCKTEKRDGHSSQNQLKSSRRDYGMYVVCPFPSLCHTLSCVTLCPATPAQRYEEIQYQGLYSPHNNAQKWTFIIHIVLVEKKTHIKLIYSGLH